MDMQGGWQSKIGDWDIMGGKRSVLAYAPGVMASGSFRPTCGVEAKEGEPDYTEASGRKAIEQRIKEYIQEQAELRTGAGKSHPNIATHRDGGRDL